MEAKAPRIHVFEKKEIFLLLLVMLFLAATSFSVGVKLGRKISYSKNGYVDSDRQLLDLKSTQEEDVTGLVDKNSGQNDIQLKENDLDQKVFEKLEDEFNSLNQGSAQKNSTKKQMNFEKFEKNDTSGTKQSTILNKAQ